MCVAERIDRAAPTHGEIAQSYLTKQPKAQLYLGLGDFNFCLMHVEKAYLNGGFGKAFVLTAADLAASDKPKK
jgi:heme iron utilization protein